MDRKCRSLHVLAAVAGLALSACAPPPPFEEVNDPFAAQLPQSAPVQTQPLAPPGALSDEVIIPADGVPPAGTSPADGTAAPSDTLTVVNAGGLVERLPNTCKLENYQQYQGQDGATAAAQVFDRPVRVIAPDDIVSQVYDPQRVNFYTDASGRVARISCG